MNDGQFREVLSHLGLSWEGYRKVRKGVKKRLARHLHELRCRNVEAYLRLLDEDPKALREARELLTVSISRFFRDRRLWEVIASRIIPRLMERKDPIIRVWSAGCGAGEEAMSFLILWDWARRERGEGPEIQIWATDLNPRVLDRGRQGVYGESSLREVPQRIREDYFQPLDHGKWKIASGLPEQIRWEARDLLSDDPPEKDLHLIFLRNSLFTYYREDHRRKVLTRLLEALRPGGFLAIGAHEKLPSGVPGLRALAEYPSLFQKEEAGGEDRWPRTF